MSNKNMSDKERRGAEANPRLGETPSALAIQVLPMGIVDRAEVWALVDQAIEAIDRTGLSYTVGPFETVVEGPLDRLLEVAATVHKTVLAKGTPTVATYMKLWSGQGIGTSTEKTETYRARGH